MLLFFVGIVEMVIIAVWTKSVVKEQVWASGVISFINILIWYYVLETIVQDINNISLVLLYAFGCALGTMLASVAPSMWHKIKESRLEELEEPMLVKQDVQI